MEIGKQIKKLRMTNDLTQEQLGEKLNVARTTISSWETGRTYPDLDMILALSVSFDVTLDELLRGDEGVIEKIVEDVKDKRKYKMFSIILSIILVVLLALFSMKVLSVKNLDENNIENVSFNENNLVVEIDTSVFYDYSGYFLDGDNKVMSLTILQGFNLLSNGTSETLEIPLDDLPEDVQQINILNSKGEIVKKIKR